MDGVADTIWLFDDHAYLHTDGASWAPRRGAWGQVGVETSPSAEAVLEEFERRSTEFNRGRPIPVILDDARALGPGAAHTSRLRWLADDAPDPHKTLVVYLRGEPRRLLYAICHEVAHNLLYAEGLTRLSAPRHASAEVVSLISQISTSTSHPLAMQRLEALDFHVFSHEAARAERFLKAVRLGSAGLSQDETALIAAEFAVALGQYWLAGARSALRRFSSMAADRAEEFRPILERCMEGVEATEKVRRDIAEMLLVDPRIEGVNPLDRVAGPRSGRTTSSFGVAT